MACEEWRRQFDSYLDGEIGGYPAASLMEHLRGCTGCATEVLETVLLKRAVLNAGKRYAPSVELRHKLAQSFAERNRPRTRPWWGFAAAPAFALLTIAVLVLNVYVGGDRVAQRRVYSEFTDLHVATLASSTPVDVISTDRHTVKPWFQGKIPFTFNLPEVSGTEFSLTGGRIFYLEQVSGAHLIYRIRKHDISVFIVPLQEGASQSFPSGARTTLSFQTEAWTKNGLRYFVIGDAGAADIQALSKLLRDAG